jgi:hypothetical protein
MALSPPSDKNQQHSLQPRYRRLLGVGALLDESIRLYREHWRTFLAVSAISLVPLGLIGLAFTFAFSSPLAQNLVRVSARGNLILSPQEGSALVAGAIAGSVLFVLISIAVSMLWTAAITRTAGALMHDEQLSIKSAYARALRSLLALIGAAVLFGLGIIGLTILSIVPFVITLFGTLGSLIALVAIIVWWRSPASRKPWLKWLIILCAPYGLPVYFAVRWSMFVPAVVLERLGPVAALGRSSRLMAGEWFRAAGVLSIASVIVGVLVSAPTYLVEIPFGIVSAARGSFGPDPVQTVIANGVSLLCQVLFASVGTIAYTVLFTDLRNRREGTDLVQRVAQLEATV